MIHIAWYLLSISCFHFFCRFIVRFLWWILFLNRFDILSHVLLWNKILMILLLSLIILFFKAHRVGSQIVFFLWAWVLKGLTTVTIHKLWQIHVGNCAGLWCEICKGWQTVIIYLTRHKWIIVLFQHFLHFLDALLELKELLSMFDKCFTLFLFILSKFRGNLFLELLLVNWVLAEFDLNKLVNFSNHRSRYLFHHVVNLYLHSLLKVEIWIRIVVPFNISYLTYLLLDPSHKAVIAKALTKTRRSDTLPLLNIFSPIFKLGTSSAVSVWANVYMKRRVRL